MHREKKTLRLHAVFKLRWPFQQQSAQIQIASISLSLWLSDSTEHKHSHTQIFCAISICSARWKCTALLLSHYLPSTYTLILSFHSYRFTSVFVYAYRELMCLFSFAAFRNRIVFLLNWLELCTIFLLNLVDWVSNDPKQLCMCEVFCDLFVFFFICLFCVRINKEMQKKSLHQVVWLMRAHSGNVHKRNTRKRIQFRLFFTHSTRILCCCILIAIVSKVGLLVTVHLCLQNTSFLHSIVCLVLVHPQTDCFFFVCKRYVCFHHYNTFGMCCDSSKHQFINSHFQLGNFFLLFVFHSFRANIFFYIFIMLLTDEQKKNMRSSELCILAKTLE